MKGFSVRAFVVFIAVVVLAISAVPVKADAGMVISLGADLTEEQRNQILDLFGEDEDSALILEVTNQEERAYLEGLVSKERIGTRAISSALVEPLEEGAGISVEIHNINWVTKEMYANAMATAGLENARVVAAAPFDVSGTAALTGIMKAFEEASGKNLNEEAKKTANEELVTTGELGEDIGKDKAAALVQEIKERILKENIKEPEDIRRIIIEIAGELDIKLSQEHIDRLAELMERISRLDLNVENISKQLEKITGSLDKIRKTVAENKGLIQKILDAIKAFFEWLAGLLS
jgi:uncharacterized protein YpuA (DUF1002 family)